VSDRRCDSSCDGWEDGLRDYQNEIIDDFDRLVARSVWHRPTPQVTIEATMYAVRERGLGAFTESANIKQLTCCDDAAHIHPLDFSTGVVDDQ
jgi:hypothetical protein